MVTHQLLKGPFIALLLLAWIKIRGPELPIGFAVFSHPYTVHNIDVVLSWILVGTNSHVVTAQSIAYTHGML